MSDPATREPSPAVPLLAGPTGLGTAISRLPAFLAALTPAADGVYPLREWGDGSHSPLYCPPTARVNEVLGETVNQALVAWAGEVGIYADRLDSLASMGLGRLIMLAHPDTDDVDSLLLAAQLNAVWWAADDYYADEPSLGAVPEKLSERLALMMTALDPPPEAPEPHQTRLDQALRDDPLLVAAMSARDHLHRYAIPEQTARVIDATAQMYVSWNTYAAWQHNQQTPPVWRYLATRQHDSFHTSMTLIDIVGGYQLPGDLCHAPLVRHAAMQAGIAAVISNDLHSMAKDTDSEGDFNLPTLIAAEAGCGTDEAVEATVDIHNHYVRQFERAHRQSLALASPHLYRYMNGLRDWIGGGFEWHATSPRYNALAKETSDDRHLV